MTLAVVLQVRDGDLQALLWQRAQEPFKGRWSLPGGYLAERDTLEESIRRHLAEKVDVREVVAPRAARDARASRSAPERMAARDGVPGARAQRRSTPSFPAIRAGIRSTASRARVRPRPIVLAGRERLRAKLSYTNLGFALAPDEFTISELRDLYAAALGHDVSATNLQRVLLRRDVLEATGRRRAPGPTGGRPGALFRFRTRGSRSPISSRSCARRDLHGSLPRNSRHGPLGPNRS